MKPEVRIPARKIMSELTLTVNLSGVRAMRARIWIGKQFLRLAARIIGCGIEISA